MRANLNDPATRWLTLALLLSSVIALTGAVLCSIVAAQSATGEATPLSMIAFPITYVGTSSTIVLIIVFTVKRDRIKPPR